MCMLNHFSRVRLCDPMDNSSPGSSESGRFSRQEYWSGLHALLQGNLLDSGIELLSPVLAGGFFTTSATWEAH